MMNEYHICDREGLFKQKGSHELICVFWWRTCITDHWEISEEHVDLCTQENWTSVVLFWFQRGDYTP